MEKFLGTILTILIVIYLLRIVGRLLFPFILKLFVRKMEKKMKEQGGAFYTNMGGNTDSYQQTHEEGDVTVQFTQNKKTNDKGQTISEELGGEYVDFEEVK